jgi:hypothetical protein
MRQNVESMHGTAAERGEGGRPDRPAAAHAFKSTGDVTLPVYCARCAVSG